MLLIICCVSGSGRGKCFGEQALFERLVLRTPRVGDADPSITLWACGGRGVHLAPWGPLCPAWVVGASEEDQHTALPFWRVNIKTEEVEWLAVWLLGALLFLWQCHILGGWKASYKWGIEHKRTLELFLALDTAAADITMGNEYRRGTEPCGSQISLLNVVPCARPQRPKSVVGPDAF